MVLPDGAKSRKHKNTTDFGLSSYFLPFAFSAPRTKNCSFLFVFQFCVSTQRYENYRKIGKNTTNCRVVVSSCFIWRPARRKHDTVQMSYHSKCKDNPEVIQIWLQRRANHARDRHWISRIILYSPIVSV